MIGRRHRLAALLWLALLLPGGRAEAGFAEVYQADADLDRMSAADLAVAAVAADPRSADAVAAAGWWLVQLTELPEPERILRAVDGAMDPELGFMLARIEGSLAARPPAGTLATAELAGPFGVHPTLDLDRDVVPSDDELPPLGTGWRGVASPFRLQLTTADGTVEPPEFMTTTGVYLAAWTLALDEDLSGWLAVEAEGGFNMELDGEPVVGLRRCGRIDPAVSWYRITLDRGRHRIRIAMASPVGPQLRVSLFDENGRPVSVAVETGARGPWALSDLERALPPAAAELSGRLAEGGAPPELRLAARLARDRGDPISQYLWLERARDAAPEDPWTRLALARYHVEGSTGEDPAADRRRARQELRWCRDLPAARLVERTVALQERRTDDAERILSELVVEHGNDPRILLLWVREAVRQGWAREAEEGMARLATLLPESRGVAELRLAALGALDRDEERRQLLFKLLENESWEPRLVEELNADCLVDEALTTFENLRERFDDPRLDVSLVRLALGRGDRERARAELDSARGRWGDLRVFDQLKVMVEAHDEEMLRQGLAEAISRDPSDLELRTLSWRLGDEPFFEPFRVNLDEVIRAEESPPSEIDVVLLLDQAVERVFEDGSSLYYYHGVSRAITPVGARQASILQPLSDAYWIRVRVIKPDGRVVIPTDLDMPEGVLELEDVKPGDLVEEEYVARIGAIEAFPNGHLSPYVYRFADVERAFGLSEYQLILPPEIDLKVEGNFEGLEREEWQEDGLRIVRWRAEQMPPIAAEPLSPPNQDLLPWVSYGFGVSWQDVGDVFRDRMLEIMEPSVELERWSEPLMTGGDPLAEVRGLVEAVCDEIEEGRSVLSLSSTAGEHFSRRSGNRLAIVASVLAEAGWDLDLVLARPSPLAGRNLGVPTLDAFSEPILVARRDGREVWIDLEEHRRGVDHIRPILQGGDGLVMPLSRPSEPVTIADPLPRFENPELEHQVKVAAIVDSSGTAQIEFSTAVRGREAERLRQQIEGVPDDRANQVYEQLAANLFPGAVDVRGVLVSDDEGTVVRLELTLPDACEPDRGALVCRSLVMARPLVPAMASLPERAYPLILGLPILRRLELDLTLPEGWVIERPERRLQATWGSVQEQLVLDGNRVQSVLLLDIPARTVSPEEYPEFARFCHAVDELSSRPPRLRPASP
jgi:hypothetical protein